LGAARDVLGVAGMNKIAFGFKRGHHSVLRLLRVFLTDKDLTPAQYDLLHALRWRKYEMRQKDMRKVLGPSRQTVSEMLIALERRGLVRREIDPTDRRCKLVWITDEGTALYDAAYDPLVKHGWVRYALSATLGTDGYPARAVPDDCLEKVEMFDGNLWSFRRGLGDTGSLSYSR
jgi:DNA-binding MarR family transcriptional regulator